MAGKKYLNDYKVVYYNDKNGKVRTTSEYIGTWYMFRYEAEIVAKTKLAFLLSAFILAVCFIAPLCVKSNSINVWYVAVPFVMGYFPIFFLIVTVFRLVTAGDLVTREMKDKLEFGFNIWAPALLALSGISLLGRIVFCFLGKILFGDVISLILGVFMTFIAAAFVLLRKNLQLIYASKEYIDKIEDSLKEEEKVESIEPGEME